MNYFFENNLFNMGINLIYMFHFYIITREPWKTQKLVRQILLEPTLLLQDTENGKNLILVKSSLPSTRYLKEMDDDAGIMSSWFVLSSMDYFSLPGVPYIG